MGAGALFYCSDSLFGAEKAAQYCLAGGNFAAAVFFGIRSVVFGQCDEIFAYKYFARADDLG